MARKSRASRLTSGSNVASGSTSLRAHQPDEATVVRAVRSLYADRVKPVSRLLRKRTAEHTNLNLEDRACVHMVRGPLGPLPDIDADHLRSVCESSDSLEVVMEQDKEGRIKDGQWFVLLRDGSGDLFVDVDDDADPYPEELWARVRRYVDEELTEELPNSRYTCACKLRRTGPQVLQDLSLGEVMHVVRLATNRGLLRYLDSSMVPCSWADRPPRPLEQSPSDGLSGPPSEGEEPIATLEKAFEALKSILETEPAPVPLSNVKRLLRAKHRLRLCEGRFGFAKVSELLASEQFQHICELRASSGQLVVLPAGDSEACATQCAADSEMPPAAASPAAIEEREGDEDDSQAGVDLAAQSPTARSSRGSVLLSGSPTPNTPLRSPGTPDKETRQRWGPAHNPLLAPTPARCLVQPQRLFVQQGLMLPAAAVAAPQAAASLVPSPVAGVVSVPVASPSAISAPTPSAALPAITPRHELRIAELI